MTKIGVLGCGLVGSYVALHLQSLSEIKVYFIGRSASWKEEFSRMKLTTSHVNHPEGTTAVEGSELNIVTSLDEIYEVLDYLIISVKRNQLKAVANQIQSSSRKPKCIVTLMNGANSTLDLQNFVTHLSPGDIVEGIWSPNVVRTVTSDRNLNYHVGTFGFCFLQGNEKGKDLAKIFNESGLETKTQDSMVNVQYGKLLINLNNAINALSGVSLKEELEDPGYRFILAESMREALRCYELNGITPISITPLPFYLLPAILHYVPNFLFLMIMPYILKVDEKATSSMYEDLKSNRETEIDFLQGEICRLADLAGIKVPYNVCIRDKVKEREALKEGIKKYSPSDLFI